jgi:hypothetical protein
METITVRCERAQQQAIADEVMDVTLYGVDLTDLLNEVTLEAGLEALIDAHDFGAVFDAIMDLRGDDSDEADFSEAL